MECPMYILLSIIIIAPLDIEVNISRLVKPIQTLSTFRKSSADFSKFLKAL